MNDDSQIDDYRVDFLETANQAPIGEQLTTIKDKQLDSGRIPAKNASSTAISEIGLRRKFFLNTLRLSSIRQAIANLRNPNTEETVRQPAIAERKLLISPESLTEEISSLEAQLQTIKSEHPLPQQYVKSHNTRQEVLSNLEQQGVLEASAQKALQRVLIETDFLTVFEQLNFPISIRGDKLEWSNKKVTIVFGKQDLLQQGKRASFWLDRAGKPTIDVVLDAPRTVDVFTIFLLPYYPGSYPGSLADLGHEFTHATQFLQEQDLAKQKKFDLTIASPVMQGRPLAEAIAWRTGQTPFSIPDTDQANADSQANPLWKLIKKQGYDSQAIASDNEWKAAFHVVDNLLSLGFTTPEITSFFTKGSRFTEHVATSGESQNGSFPTLEAVIDQRLVKLGLMREHLPALRKRYNLQRQVSSQKAASICRDEFLSLLDTQKIAL